MIVKATPIKSQDLKPGDLFSIMGDEYWSTVDTHESIGEKVWLRTNTPTPLDQMDLDMFRIDVMKEKHEQGIKDEEKSRDGASH